jgi:AcrR family transcriptional regulator
MPSSDHRWRRPRSYHHGNLKEVLLEAARALIEQYGPAGFSLTEAARLAGVSPAAPYRHFRDREALLAEVARSGFDRFAARLDMAWNNGVPTPFAAFDALGRAYLTFAREEPASYAVMFEAGLQPEDAARMPGAAKAFDVLLKAAAALCRGLPEKERPPVRLMSLHIWAISHGVATLFAHSGTRPEQTVPMSAEEILESAMLIYLRGLGILPDDKTAAS